MINLVLQEANGIQFSGPGSFFSSIDIKED
ncbi:hypothetical protein SAMN05216326_12921 [Nitrosomonas marina]|uniref:Uncharacterized protein n=1 Tax=Nitrosomonas marina TaxID=917 RepID=A0A1I0ENF7_9PROT|nr:hypothetical protein SAMN05216326_12921 [Nitrosomonas marina]